jgi:hypothetical protein
MDLVAVWYICRLSFKMLWTDPDKIPNVLATSWSVILSLFKDKFLHFIYIFICLLLMHIASIRHLYQKWHHIWFGTPLKKTCTSCFLLSKSCFQHFQSYSSIFSWFKAKFDADTAIFKCSVLYVGQNRKYINSQLYWTSHYSVIILATGLFQSENDSAHSNVSTHISRNSCQQQ